MVLGTSRFLLGLLQETSEAVAAQIDLWDRSNVIEAACTQVTSRSQLARDAETKFKEHIAKPLYENIHAGIKSVFGVPSAGAGASIPETSHPLDFHIRKFCRLAAHAWLHVDHEPDEANLHDWGLEIERDAIRCLRETDDRGFWSRIKGEPRSGFEGNSLDDLVRYVLQRTFQNLDAEFQKKSPSEQEEIARRIATALRDLPPEEQERIRRAARLPDLTAETLRQTGMLAALGVGVSGLVGVAGFSAYTTLVSVVAGIAGIVGVHLSFATYMILTSAMAGLTNPFVFIPMIAGGGAWMASKANRSIRGALYPTFVATAVLAYTTSDDRKRDLTAFRNRMATLISAIDSATGMQLISLVQQFPGLGSPRLLARIASHVFV